MQVCSWKVNGVPSDIPLQQVLSWLSCRRSGDE
jgi:hypothetical protein